MATFVCHYLAEGSEGRRDGGLSAMRKKISTVELAPVWLTAKSIISHPVLRLKSLSKTLSNRPVNRPVAENGLVLSVRQKSSSNSVNMQNC